MSYWQIAGGSFGRDYTTDFLRLGIAAVGGENQISQMEKVKEGHTVILKSGRHQVLAVGTATSCGRIIRDSEGRSDWLLDFDGWDLKAFCRVSWRTPPPGMPDVTLPRATICGVNDESIKAWADNVVSHGQEANESFPRDEELQARRSHVEDQEILEELINHGLRPSAADELVEAFRRIRLLAKHYFGGATQQGRTGAEVREHELRTFLVVPLLLALGWSEQQMKIELPSTQGHVDLACLRQPYFRYGSADDAAGGCVMLVETKGFGIGFDWAKHQAKNYAQGFPNCELVAVSNGYTYATYRLNGRSTGKEDDFPDAYLNLLYPRSDSLRYPGTAGAIEVLKDLMPQRWPV